MGSDDPYADRKRLTFEQAEGFEALPAQLRLKEISSELSARLWAIVYESLCAGILLDNWGGESRLGEEWSKILFDYHVYREHRAADEYTNAARFAIAKVKGIIGSRNYIQTFGFIQFVLRHNIKVRGFSAKIDQALKNARAAYRVLDGDTIVPIGF